MADGLPPISLELADNGSAYVIVDEQEANDIDALLRLAPALSDPHWIRARAQLVNHITSGFEYEVILDPDGFRDGYMTQFDSEDPEEEVGPGTVRLTHYGKPDFDAIEPPKQDGHTLIFYARESHLGVPYRVEVPDGGDPVYTPMAMGQE